MKRQSTIFIALVSAFSAASASAQDAPTYFGFPAGFSASKMDDAVSPRHDFTRYAAGKWFDAMEIPADQMGVSGLSLMTKRSVADGDTITVLDASKVQYKIRLSGIDAPEKAQPFGDRSKQNLARMVFNKDVSIEWSKQDRYGRIVGKVMVQPAESDDA